MMRVPHRQADAALAHVRQRPRERHAELARDPAELVGSGAGGLDLVDNQEDLDCCRQHLDLRRAR